jgi:hypothetical protein
MQKDSEAQAVDRSQDAVVRWGVVWDSRSPFCRKTGHLLWHKNMPALFPSRNQARAWIKAEYGWIATRADLRKAPHHWRMPKAVQVTITPNPSGDARTRTATNHKSEE